MIHVFLTVMGAVMLLIGTCMATGNEKNRQLGLVWLIHGVFILLTSFSSIDAHRINEKLDKLLSQQPPAATQPAISGGKQ